MSLRPATFLDRDGTIIVERDYLSDPNLVELENGVVEGLRRIAEEGWPLVVLTNQSGIARGYFDLAAAEAVNRRVAQMLAEEGIEIAGWYICPHSPHETCSCRKPRPGLAHQAASELELNINGSWMIGDKRSDVALADAIGGRGILVATGHGSCDIAWARAAGALVARDMVAAADIICGKRGALGRS
jgi:D-glycero-D-manno-heptose 1,7-bisphosphate phosphatase